MSQNDICPICKINIIGDDRHKYCPIDTKYKKQHDGIKGRAKKKKELCLSLLEFINFMKMSNRICSYCNIPENKLYLIKSNCNVLTIDRKDNNKGYVLDNICLACYRCNTLKSNVFSYEEMKDIGIRFLETKWKNLL